MAKRALGQRIVSMYHGPDDAARAEAQFDRVFRDHAVPEHVPEVRISLADPRLRVAERGTVWLPGLVVAAGLAASNSEAARLIEQGAVLIDERRVTDRNAEVPARAGTTVLAQRGKRHFARVRFEG